MLRDDIREHRKYRLVSVFMYECLDDRDTIFGQ
jgi:hypothetical protein